jgi:hypothetical protein
MYNQEDDKLLFEIKPLEDDVNIKGEVYSYKGGAPKLQLTRISNDGKFLKLGRLSLSEVKFLQGEINDIVERMENFKQ